LIYKHKKKIREGIKMNQNPKKEITPAAAVQKFSQLASSCEVQLWLRSTWQQ
jgi:hypothetical protein